jgi:CRISPR-associated endonuclease/helicase Cas3
LAALGLDHIEVHVLMGGAIAKDWDDAPEREVIIIGTQDQLLSRALNRGYAMSRFRWPIHFGWLNNDCVWVMDEVQLMGSGLSTSAQLHALRERFGTFGPCHTMWMSATLARGLLDTVDLRPIALRHQGLGAADRKALSTRLKAKKPLERLDTDPKKPAATAKQLLALHKAGTLTLVVVNRVARARELAQALRKSAVEVEVELIHSRFRPYERGAAQRKALEPGWSGILVATQAIEAGVDIDARILVSDLASWPSLVQRFGRCNRAGARKDAHKSLSARAGACANSTTWGQSRWPGSGSTTPAQRFR